MPPRIDPHALALQINNLRITHPELAEDLEDWLCALESQTDVLEALEAIDRQLSDTEAQIPGMAERIKDLQARKDRIERRRDALRDLMFRIMDMAGLRGKPVHLVEHTLSIVTSPPKVLITDEAAIPDQYVKVERTPKKTEILKAIQANENVPGAVLSNGGERLNRRGK